MLLCLMSECLQTRLPVCPGQEEPQVGECVDQVLLPVPGQDQDPHHDCLQPAQWQDCQVGNVEII